MQLSEVALQLGSVVGMLNLISSSPARELARCIAARKVHWSPAVDASVSHPTVGFKLSPSPVVLTSINEATGAATTVLTPIFGSDTWPHGVAKPAGGIERRVTSVIISHSEIAMACEQAAKNVILDHTTAVRDAELVAALTP